MCDGYAENPKITITPDFEKPKSPSPPCSSANIGPIDLKLLEEVISSGITYLNEICDPLIGFQNTSIGQTRSELKPKKHAVEVFTSTLALDLLPNDLTSTNIENLYRFVMPEYKYGTINFNIGDEVPLPEDVDCTALALAVFLRDGRIENAKQCLDMVRLIVLNTNPDGVIETYFPPRGIRENRVDPATTSNVMRFLYLTGYESLATKSEDYLYGCLSSGEYLNKCYYYVCPEAFFYFLTTAITLNANARVRFEKLLVENIAKRFGVSNYVLDVSMRILALANLGLLGAIELKEKIEAEVSALLGMRKKTKNGAFNDDCLFRLGRSEIYFGGDSISTIFAIAALKSYLEFVRSVH